MDTPVKPPLLKRVNPRMLLFAGILLLVAGWPIYTFLAETLTHGIHDRGGYKEVDLKAMGYFKMDRSAATLADVPAVYRALDGQKVLLTGIVVPTREAGARISEFTLQYSWQSCCNYGSAPFVQEKVYATAAPGKTLYCGYGDRCDVLGTLHVTMKKDAGEVVEVYHLDADSIKPAH